jgi:hypothetical protein
MLKKSAPEKGASNVLVTVNGDKRWSRELAEALREADDAGEPFKPRVCPDSPLSVR